MGEIFIVGCGYRKEHLTLEGAEMLCSGRRVILHTERCECADWLREKGIVFSSLDELYEQQVDFDAHARAAAEAIRQAAAEEDIVYGVFDLRDLSVAELKGAHLIPGVPAEAALIAKANGMAVTVSASDWPEFQLRASCDALIREMDSRELASEVKLKLMEVYPEETVVSVRMPNGGIATTALYNLDRLKDYDHRTCAYVPGVKALDKLERYDFLHLIEIMKRLLDPDGCPWDREQTHQSLRQYMLEEAYEAVGAIDDDDPDHLYDELGDLLFQVAFHAELGRRHGEFDISDVTTAICEKMIRRHSHVFGNDQVASTEDVNSLWMKNKMAERCENKVSDSLRDVTASMPAEMRASKVLNRASRALNYKESVEAARKDLMALAGQADDEKTVGDLLLCAIALARACKIDSEVALNGAVARLIERFAKLEDEGNEAAPETTWRLVKLS